MSLNASAERARTAAGKRRKALDRAVAVAIMNWRRGADGNVILGKLEQEFYKEEQTMDGLTERERRADIEAEAARMTSDALDGVMCTQEHSAEPADMTRPGDTCHEC